MKNLLLFLPVFLWIQACSQSSKSDANTGNQHTILSDTAGNALGDSPNHEYRLFKFEKQNNGQTQTDLKLLRLKDLSETLVASTPIAPKFYWSKNGRFLVVENSVPDSTYKWETRLFDLQNFQPGYQKTGKLIGFDLLNDVAFVYVPDSSRQLIRFYNMSFPEQEHQRDIIAAPDKTKEPSIIFAPKERKAKVKAYGADGVPVNVAFPY